MKNLKTYLLILFAIVIILLVFFLVKNIKNDNYHKENEKLLSEIKYMDNKLTYLLNSVNNISLENYKISVTKTSTKNKSQSQSQNGQEETSNSTSQGEESVSNSSTEQYELKENRILTNGQETDWENIKNEVEILYSTIPTLTLDLYNMNVRQDNIIDFNKDFDALTIAIKEENKSETLINLANLYRYLPAYVSNFSNDQDYINLLETKSNVFNGYVFINIENWEEANNSIKKSIDSFSKIMNSLNNNSSNYDTNKIYIILNELQRAVDLKDRDIFLIKYKSFLEETEKKNAK